MLIKRTTFALGIVLLLACGSLLVWRVWSSLAGESGGNASTLTAVPVEAVAIERGVIELRRNFSGTLESIAEFEVAPKIAGRVRNLPVDVADTVQNGQMVAVFDQDEYELEVAQSEAELEVARANLAEARSAKEIADRAMGRQSSLSERGVASDVQLEAAEADQLAAGARVAVAKANQLRAEAALKTALIRLGYTEVRAVWGPLVEGEPSRHVARRWVEIGDTVGANTPLMTIVALDPIQAVFFVSERDYARLAPGQPVTLGTDAYPAETFTGQIVRISPVFEAASRQARVEVSVPNQDLRLKPGMFVRAQATLDRVEDAFIVPAAAVVRRDDRPVVFVIDDASSAARMVAVEIGITQGERFQVHAPGLSGKVVTLGQQLLDHGSEVRLIESESAETLTPTASQAATEQPATHSGSAPR